MPNDHHCKTWNSQTQWFSLRKNNTYRDRLIVWNTIQIMKISTDASEYSLFVSDESAYWNILSGTSPIRISPMTKRVPYVLTTQRCEYIATASMNSGWLITPDCQMKMLKALYKRSTCDMIYTFFNNSSNIFFLVILIITISQFKKK